MAIGDGLISMQPSSLSVTGTSGVINSDGGVDFSSITSLSLNGVFTSAYTNYLVVLTSTLGSGSEPIYMRLRSAGTDASGTDYAGQLTYADGTSETALRITGQTQAVIAHVNSTALSGDHVYIYQPYLSTPTVTRDVNTNAASWARIVDCAAGHGLSTSYDGMTIYPNTSSISGNIHVFGYEE